MKSIFDRWLESFLAAFQKMNSYKGTAKLSTWLHTIVYRKFLDYQRKHRRQIITANLPETGQDTRQAIDNESLVEHLMGLLKSKDRAVLSCKTPAMADKEIWVYLLAYNLIRCIRPLSWEMFVPLSLHLRHLWKSGSISSRNTTYYWLSSRGIRCM